MGFWPGDKPYVTLTVRRQLNTLVEEANHILGVYLERFNRRRMDTGYYDPPWEFPHLIAMDAPIYDKHRFCEAGAQDFTDSNIWFFYLNGPDVPQANDADVMVSAATALSGIDPQSCANSSRYEDDIGWSWYCDFARYFQDSETSPNDVQILATPEKYAKAFHPRTIAFTSIKDGHFDEINRRADNLQRGPRQGSPVGSWPNAQDPEEAAIRPALTDLLNELGG